jgi:PleD family two-component response regulator
VSGDPRVLVIDDSPEIHQLLKVRLRGEGLVLLHATDPVEGLRLARSVVPDLILLDQDMPTMTGLEACRALKADPVTSHVPIVFLTGAASVTDRVAGLDAGAVDYIGKPFDPLELRARVRATLRTKRYQDLLMLRAQLDWLTGLRNRAYFDTRLADEVMAARRHGRLVSLILLDLDHFKSINDRFGHPFGDRVLQKVGDVLLDGARVTDAPCRYGGEEFGIVLT